MDKHFSIAPMLAVSDRHFRVLARLFSKQVWCYTEMVVTTSLIHGEKGRFLNFDPIEHPIALQLAGSEPAELALCGKIGAQWGYDEINLNIGCPSPRVQKGNFGACLMAEPQLVKQCVAALRSEIDTPISVKTRTGIDHRDSYTLLCRFIEEVSEGGCDHFIVHARKAWLKGLSPKQNRHTPPLQYPWVYQLKQDFPHLKFTINGGITTAEDAIAHLSYVDGVMIGRAAQKKMQLLKEIDLLLDASKASTLSTQEIVKSYVDYTIRQTQNGVPLHRMTRHLVGLFSHTPGAKAWRKHLTENSRCNLADPNAIKDALSMIKT